MSTHTATETITPATFPAGARVVGTTPGNRDKLATVTGWAGQSIGVRFDEGGTSIAPASFGGYRLATEDDLNL